MRVVLDTRQWERAINALGRKNAIKAGTRAVRRTANSARSAETKIIAANLKLKQKDVRGAIEVNVPTVNQGTPRAVLYAKSARIPLIKFNARGPEPSRGRGKGVTAKLPTGAGRYPHAWIATTKSGHRGVFERYDSGGRKGNRGPKGGKTYELKGPSIAHVFMANMAVAEARAVETLSTNFANEVKFLLSQAAKA